MAKEHLIFQSIWTVACAACWAAYGHDGLLKVIASGCVAHLVVFVSAHGDFVDYAITIILSTALFCLLIFMGKLVVECVCTLAYNFLFLLGTTVKYYDKTMPTPSDKTLYDSVVGEANERFLAKTSVYRSAWIVKEYVKRGGKYDEDKKGTSAIAGLKRWFKEKWVDINRPNEPCGRNKATRKGTYPLCRPTVRVTAKTPKTLGEIDAKTVKAANKAKQKVKEKSKIAFG